jgi:hypothetical protein
LGRLRGGVFAMSAFYFMGTYLFVSGAGRHFEESKSNSKIYRYIKTYFSLYDLIFAVSVRPEPGEVGGGVEIAFQVGVLATGFVSAAG